MHGVISPQGPTSAVFLVSSATSADSEETSYLYPILNISDIHFPLSHSEAEYLYEMLMHAYENGGVQVLIRNGDWIDGWEADDYDFSPIQEAVIDLMNRMKEDQGTVILDVDGNHNDRQMLRDVRESGQKVGLNIVPGVSIETPQDKAVVLHGHQFDSPLVKSDLLDEAHNEYMRLSLADDLHAASTASHAKKTTKRFLNVLDYQQSYVYAAHKYAVNHVVVGHRHLPEDYVIQPYGPLAIAARQFWNRSASVSQVTKQFVSASRQSAKNMGGRLAMKFFIAHGDKVVKTLSQEYVNAAFHGVAIARKFKGKDMLANVMDLIDAKPDTSILGKITFADLRPSYYVEGRRLRGKIDSVRFTDAGGWIDDNTTFLAYDASGHSRLFDWREMRKDLGYGVKPIADDLVTSHNERFGGILGLTQQEIAHYKNDVAGGLPREARSEHYALPEKAELARVIVNEVGLAQVSMPASDTPFVIRPDIPDNESVYRAPAAA